MQLIDWFASIGTAARQKLSAVWKGIRFLGEAYRSNITDFARVVRNGRPKNALDHLLQDQSHWATSILYYAHHPESASRNGFLIRPDFPEPVLRPSGTPYDPAYSLVVIWVLMFPVQGVLFGVFNHPIAEIYHNASWSKEWLRVLMVLLLDFIFLAMTCAFFVSFWQMAVTLEGRFLVRLRSYLIGALPNPRMLRVWIGGCLCVAAGGVASGVVILFQAATVTVLQSRELVNFALLWASASVAIPWIGFWSVVAYRHWPLLTASFVKSVPHIQALQITDDGPVTLSVAHLSDLHLTADENTKRVDRIGSGGNRAASVILSSLGDVLKSVDAILLTGDVTDAGLSSEWSAFCSMWAGLEAKTILTPGNHDVTVNKSWTAIEDQDYIARSVRMIRYLCAVDMIQGDRTDVVDLEGYLIPYRLFLKPYLERLEKFVASPPYRTSELRQIGNSMGRFDTTPLETLNDLLLPSIVWSMAFPMVVSISGSDAYVIVLDTNGVSSNIVTNAFGCCGEAQLRKLSSLLQRLGSRPYIVLTHHHFGLPGWLKTSAENWQTRALSMVDAKELIDVLQAGNGGVVFCGHRHVGYHGEITAAHQTAIQLVSAPSSTLGDDVIPGTKSKNVKQIGFEVFGLGWGEDRCVRIRSVKRHFVDDEGAPP